MDVEPSVIQEYQDSTKTSCKNYIDVVNDCYDIGPQN